VRIGVDPTIKTRTAGTTALRVCDDHGTDERSGKKSADELAARSRHLEMHRSRQIRSGGYVGQPDEIVAAFLRGLYTLMEALPGAPRQA